MSLLHEAIVAEKYGLRLTIEQLGKALCLAPQTSFCPARLMRFFDFGVVLFRRHAQKQNLSLTPGHQPTKHPIAATGPFPEFSRYSIPVASVDPLAQC